MNFFSGRLNQIEFTIRLLALLLFYALCSYLSYIFDFFLIGTIIYSFFFLFFYIVIPLLQIIYFCSICIRRLHDLSYEGIVLLFFSIFVIFGYFSSFGLSFMGVVIGSLGLIAIPILCLFFIAFLVFKPGLKINNKYGSPPNKTNYFLNTILGIVTILFLFALLSLSYVQSLFPKLSEYFLSKAIIPKTRTVMVPGMEISAKTPSQQINIKAGTVLSRTYLFDNCNKTITLTPMNKINRDPEGYQKVISDGLFIPSLGNVLLTIKNQNCPNYRILVDESAKDFNSEEEAINWLNQWKRDNLVYNNSGLVVNWKDNESQDKFSIDFWQILINGQKPNILEGADDNSIQVKQPI